MPGNAGATPLNARLSAENKAASAQVTLDASQYVPTSAGAPAIEAPPHFVLKWGSDGAGPAKLHDPHGIACDRSGNVYVADRGNQRVQVFDSRGTPLRRWGQSGMFPGDFQLPQDLALDNAGNVYVADMFNRRIQVFGGDGMLLRIFGGPYGFGLLNGIDVVDNVLFALDASNNTVSAFDIYGTPNSNVAFRLRHPNPQGLAVSQTGDIYVTHFSTGLAGVERYDWGGNVLSEWGSPGIGDGQFNVPMAISVDASGDVYVVDAVGARVQKFTADGTFLSAWGESGAGDGQFAQPLGIGINAQGDIYVADSGHGRIQMFSYSTRVEPMTWTHVKIKYR